jgi:hypothetical protein
MDLIGGKALLKGESIRAGPSLEEILRCAQDDKEKTFSRVILREP